MFLKWMLRWIMVNPVRFELTTCCFGGNRSIHLSYGFKLIRRPYPAERF